MAMTIQREGESDVVSCALHSPEKWRLENGKSRRGVGKVKSIEHSNMFRCKELGFEYSSISYTR